MPQEPSLQQPVPSSQSPVPNEAGRVQIQVVGVGGAGVNAVTRMGPGAVPGVASLCVNTDAAQLATVVGIPTLIIGPGVTHGLGAGGNPEVGRRAAEASRGEICSRLRGANLVFVAAGMGGGTGTGAAPVVVRAAQDVNALTVAVVTMPFSFEGRRRLRNAEYGLDLLLHSADTLIVIHNDKIRSVVLRKTPIRDAFTRADQVMVDAILAVSRVINAPGDINVDFADLQAVLTHGGMGVIATGRAFGSQRLLKAVQAAVANPLVERGAHGAKAVLFAVTAGPDLTLHELNEAGAFLADIVDPDAQITTGVHIDRDRPKNEDVDVVLIATRLPDARPDGTASVRTVAEKVKLATAHYYHALNPSQSGLDLSPN